MRHLVWKFVAEDLAVYRKSGKDNSRKCKYLAGMLVVPVFLFGMMASARAGIAGVPARDAARGIPISELTLEADKILPPSLPETRAEGIVLDSPLQGLEAVATETGLKVRSLREGVKGDFSIRPVALDRAGIAVLMDKPVPGTDGNRIVLDRGALVEYISSSAQGVRQDFVVPRRPAGDAELTLKIDVAGASVSDDVQGLRLTMDSGRELIYHRLLVFDADGQEAPARMRSVAGNRIEIAVNDAGLRYPLTIDPTITDADWFVMNSSIPGASGSIRAVISDGAGNIYFAGSFSAIGTVEASRVVKYNITTKEWSALGDGVGNTVYALAWDGANLYAGGHFTTAGEAGANRVAKWDGSAWSALGDGVDSTVYALAWDGSSLYVGGQFNNAGGAPASRIAKWDGVAWSEPGGGVNGDVRALLWNGTDLYVGGQFTDKGNRIAKWDGAWSTLDTGVNNTVYALAWDGTDLYVGGTFTDKGTRIAKWDGTDWSALLGGLNNTVSSLAWDGANLYIGGWFTTVGDGIQANRVAKWDGSAWSALGAGVNLDVNALAWDGTNLYAGGYFTEAGGNPASRIAKWDGSAWSALGAGVNDGVNALAWDGTNLYVGGDFTDPGSRIAKWDGTSWTALGINADGDAWALLVVDGILYAGGTFDVISGTTVNHIAKWNGISWSALDGGMNNSVYALGSDGTNLYAGGSFTTAGGDPANRIAKWDGTSWSTLGDGVNGDVWTIEWHGDNLYAGGRFTTAGGAPANRIAKWDGTSWSTLGSGIQGVVGAPVVYALLCELPNLYVGGSFTTAGTNFSPYLAGVALVKVPAVTTVSTASNITATTAVLGGEVTDDGGATSTERGIVWAATETPTVSDNKATMGSGEGVFSDTVTGLPSGTLLYARAYASNAAGVAYGSQISFTTEKQNQTITFPEIPEQTVVDTVGLTATASSGLTVSFTVASGPADISDNNVLSFTGTGTVAVRASQGGNQNWNAAPDVVNTINVIEQPDPPDAPTGVSASDGTYSYKVWVTWNAPADATSYKLYRHTLNDSGTATLLDTTTGTTYADTAAVAGQTYYYWVKAVNATGRSSGYSSGAHGWRGVTGPVVAVNGLVGDNVCIPDGTFLTITVEMMNLPADYLGYEVDYWVAAHAQDFGLWYYLSNASLWTPFDGLLENIRPAYQGPLMNLQPVKVAEGLRLDPGVYTIWFVVDYPMDGVLNLTAGAHLLSQVTLVVE